MVKKLLKLLEISLILYLIFVQLIESEIMKEHDKNQELQLKVKRELLNKAKKFLKQKPMSNELKLFINQIKRKKKSNRKKREDLDELDELDENSLFIIKDGHLVPFERIKDFRRSNSDNKGTNNNNNKEQARSFTVIPLVVPISGSNDKFSLKPPKLIKSREISEDPISCAPNDNSSIDEGATFATIDDENQANEQENKVLHQILEDVENLMQSRGEGRKKEGVLCNINGSWVSDVAGMQFDISYTTSTRKKFKINVSERTPPNEEGFFCDGNWIVFGEKPFKHSGLIVALAVHSSDKHIATFIGECRVCEGSETVTGTWLVGRSSRDCKDQKASHQVLSDVWRRESIGTLRKKHFKELGFTVQD